MGKLDGKVAIIVGSTSGIGKAIAERFAEENAVSIVTGRREEQGAKVVEGIRQRGGNAEFMKLDVYDLDACYSLIDTVVQKYGKLDIFYYNTGIPNLGNTADDTIGAITEKVWDSIFTVNLRNAYFMAQKAIPEIIKTKGVILFTDSMSGVSAKINGHIVVYAATKAALAHIIKIMALNYAGKGVRVNGIAPGVTNTDILAGVAPEILDHAKATIPLQKIGQPEDMANAALFLACDDSAFITGQIISVCGGQSIG